MTDTTPTPPPPPPAAAGISAGPRGDVRSPVFVIVMWFITLGIYGLYWQYKVFKELKEHTGEGIGGVIGLILAILLGIVNVFLLPSEIGNMYARGAGEARAWCHRLLGADPDRRLHHLGREGPGRDEPSLGQHRRLTRPT